MMCEKSADSVHDGGKADTGCPLIAAADAVERVESDSTPEPAAVALPPSDDDRFAEGHSAGYAAGFLAGQRHERDRVLSVLAHRAFRDAPELARECIRQGHSAEQARAFMDTSPEAQPAQPGPFRFPFNT